MLEALSIEMPIDSKGELDLNAQKTIASEYQKIENINVAIKKELDKILKTNIAYE